MQPAQFTEVFPLHDSFILQQVQFPSVFILKLVQLPSVFILQLVQLPFLLAHLSFLQRDATPTFFQSNYQLFCQQYQQDQDYSQVLLAFKSLIHSFQVIRLLVIKLVRLFVIRWVHFQVIMPQLLVLQLHRPLPIQFFLFWDLRQLHVFRVEVLLVFTSPILQVSKPLLLVQLQSTQVFPQFVTYFLIIEAFPIRSSLIMYFKAHFYFLLSSPQLFLLRFQVVRQFSPHSEVLLISSSHLNSWTHVNPFCSSFYFSSFSFSSLPSPLPPNPLLSYYYSLLLPLLQFFQHPKESIFILLPPYYLLYQSNYYFPPAMHQVQ